MKVIPGNPKCRSCSLHREAKTVCQPAIHDPLSLEWSDATPTLVIVGDRPGIDEDRSGLPFTGPTGILLAARPGVPVDLFPASLVEMGNFRARSSVWFTNAIRCYTPSNSPPPMSYPICTDLYLEPLLTELWTPNCAVLALGSGAVRSVMRLGNYKKRSIRDAFGIQGSQALIGGRIWTVFFGQNPAVLLHGNSPEQARSFVRYISLVSSWLDGFSTPTHQPVPLDPITQQPYPPLEEPPFDSEDPYQTLFWKIS